METTSALRAPRGCSSPLRIAVVEDHPDFRTALCRTIEATPGLLLLGVARDVVGGLALVDSECPDILLVDLGLPDGSGRVVFRTAQALWGARCTSAVLTVTGNEEDLLLAVRSGAQGYLFKSDQPDQWVRTIQRLAQGHSPLHPATAGLFLRWCDTHPAAEPVLDAGASHDADTSSATGSDAPQPPLDPRTRSLLQHLAAGYTLPEIRQRLHLTEAQAGPMIRRLYDQLNEPVPNLTRRELELLRHLNTGLTFRQCAERMGVSESTTKTQSARAYEKLGASNLQSALYAARQAGLLP